MLRSSLLLAVLLGIMATGGRPAVAADRLDADTIKAALRTATPAEEAFVDRVVQLMAQKKLVNFFNAQKVPLDLHGRSKDTVAFFS